MNPGNFIRAAIFDEPLSLKEIARIAIVSRLRMCSGNIEAASQSLNVSRNFIYRKIEAWKITPEEYSGRKPYRHRRTLKTAAGGAA